MEDLDYAALGSASDTRAIYRIVNMDCPSKEKKPARGRAGARKPGTKKTSAKKTTKKSSGTKAK